MTPAGPDSEHAETRIEAEGESLGEAKWSAVRALQRSFPGIDADAVRFEVLDEGSEADDRLARVSAEPDLDAWREQANDLPEEPTERVRALVTRIVQALELDASVDVSEDKEEIRATVNGDDLGLLIGKHGATIDAVQHLATRTAFRGEEERKRVTVDAAGYRDRREASLHRAADRAVEDALQFGRAVELEPMSSSERRTVHEYLRDRTEIQTHSEGDEPERRLVVSPVGR